MKNGSMYERVNKRVKLRDVVIGRGGKGSAPKFVLDLERGVAAYDNGTAYWIENAYIGANLLVFKNTAAGKRLHKMLRAGYPLVHSIRNYLEQLVLARISRADLGHLLNVVYERAYMEGHDGAQKIIRDALGLE